MITIPSSSNTGIRIPAKVTQPMPEPQQTESIERIGVSIQDAAKMLGISKPHFYPLIREEKIRAVRIGRRILVSVQSLRDFVDGEKSPGNSAKNAPGLHGQK